MDRENEKICRFCLSPATENEELYFPCKCIGSMGYIHKNCLLSWVDSIRMNSCEICRFKYIFEYEYSKSFPLKKPLLAFLNGLIYVFLLITKRLMFNGPLMYIWYLSDKYGSRMVNFPQVYMLSTLFTPMIIVFCILIIYLFGITQKYCRNRMAHLRLDVQMALNSLEVMVADDSIYTDASQNADTPRNIESSFDRRENYDSNDDENTETVSLEIPNHDTSSVEFERENSRYAADIFLNEALQFMTSHVTLNLHDYTLRVILNNYLVIFKIFMVFFMIFIGLIYLPLRIGSFFNLKGTENEIIILIEKMNHLWCFNTTIQMFIGLFVIMLFVNFIYLFKSRDFLSGVLIHELHAFMRIIALNVLPTFLCSYLSGFYIYLLLLKYLNLGVLVNHNESTFNNAINIILHPLDIMKNTGIFADDGVMNKLSSISSLDYHTVFLFMNKDHRSGILNFLLFLASLVLNFILQYKIMNLVYFTKEIYVKTLRPGMFYTLYLTKGLDIGLETFITETITFILRQICYVSLVYFLLIHIIVKMVSIVLCRYEICFIINSPLMFITYIVLLKNIFDNSRGFQIYLTELLKFVNVFVAQYLGLGNFMFNQSMNDVDNTLLVWRPNKNTKYYSKEEKLVNDTSYTNEDVEKYYLEHKPDRLYQLFYKPRFFIFRIAIVIFVNCILLISSFTIILYLSALISYKLKSLVISVEKRFFYIEIQKFTGKFENIIQLFQYNYDRSRYSFIFLLFSMSWILKLFNYFITLFLVCQRRDKEDMRAYARMTKYILNAKLIFYMVWPLIVGAILNSLFKILQSFSSKENLFNAKGILITAFVFSLHIKLGFNHFVEWPQSSSVEQNRIYSLKLLHFTIAMFMIFFPVYAIEVLTRQIVNVQNKKFIFCVTFFVPILLFTMYFAFNILYKFFKRKGQDFYDFLYLKDRVPVNYNEISISMGKESNIM